MRTRARAGAVDTALITAAFGIEEPTLEELLDAPTQELVKDFLTALTGQAKDVDALKADKLRADVELENTVRTGESRAKGLKATINKGLHEIEELRKKLDQQENARAELQTELASLNASSTDSSTELGTLRARVATLEASNRDTLSVLESKSTSHDKLAEELATQHQNIIALRRRLSSLEDKNQSLENAASAARFKEQSLQQELDLLKRNNEWQDNELKTRAAEQTKFRKEKNARISELQRSLEDANTTMEAMKRTESALRQRLDQLGQKADDAFAKIQHMQEGASKAEESFRVELDSARRLADLQKQSADTAKARLRDLQDTIDQIKDSAADEVGQLQAEIETERSIREAVEQKLAELELEVERLETEAQTRPTAPSVPSTPQRASNGLMVGTPGRAGSPFGTPATVRAKGNLTFTQLYSEYSAVKLQLDVEKRRNFQLSTELDEMIRDLENRGPEQEELRQEKERVDAEIIEMSSMLEAVTAERDEARHEARSLSGQFDGLTREGDILRQQLRDLSAQIKILLVEMQARDQGLESLDAAGQVQLQMLANGELDDQSPNDETSAGALISQRLLLFRNVKELQDQNVQLLKLNRGLADRMEGQAAKAREAEQETALQELDELRDRVQRHQDEIRSMTTQMESIIRERDMFRRMLSHRGQLPPGADVQTMFGQSVDGRATPSTPQRGAAPINVDQTPHSKELSDYSKLLKDMQSHFDAYRQEAATDHGTLKQQVDRLAREKNELQGEIARTSGQITLAHERYEMLQANYAMLKTENGELQKRSQSLAEGAAKQDLRTQQVAEELVEARALTDSMRTDTANLKAERELWRKIEARLTEDNRALMDERSRLNKLTADLQNLQNERELADSETRRRLQSRADALETELESTKKKLETELDEARKSALRREYDQEQSRTRIDDLVKSLSNVREELVAAKTTRDQLQARVDELKIDLRTAEERAQALQPRPTPRADQPSNNGESVQIEGNALSREQELALEITELKRDLDLTRTELESAKSQVEQYKAISQSSEEELQSLNDTNDQYREDMDRIISEKDAKIQDLEGRLQDLGTELTTTNNELSALRTKTEEGDIRLEEQKLMLEAEIARLHDESERHAENAKLHQEDLKAQAEIAQQAQQSYENELVKHADAAKNLQSVRSEYHQLRTEVAGIKAEAEAAKASLSQSEENWSEVRDRYEGELTELRLSREDIKSQNKLLHEQLESVSTQISALQQRKAITEEEDAEAPAGSEFENLQEVIKYLRREKEIVDVQYELSVQESKRLRQQLEYAQSQLDDARQKLSEERQDQADKEANAVSHTKLMQTINELNLFRESSTTLRQEARQAQTQLAEKVKEVETLIAQIQPLQDRTREVENELETKEGELKLLQEDRDRWRERTQNIISKYDRVDPAEMEALKTQITDLSTQRDQLTAEKQGLQEKIDAVPEEMERTKVQADKAWQEQRAKIIQQAKDRSREQAATIRERTQELTNLREEHERMVQELTQVKQEVENTRTERDEAVARADAAAQQAENADEHEEGQIQEQGHEEQSSSSAALEEAEARASQEASRAEALGNEVEGLQARVQELESHINDLQQRLDSSNSSLSELQNQTAELQTRARPESQPATGNENVEDLEKLKADLVTSQQEVEALRAAAAAGNDSASNQAAAMPSTETEQTKSVSEQVAEQVKVLEDELKAQHALSKKELDDAFSQKVTDMKKKLNDKFKEMKEKVREEGRQEAIAKHSEAIQNLRTEHEAAIQRLQEEHRLVVERLTQEGQAAVEKAMAREQAGTVQPKQEEQLQEKAHTETTSPATLDVAQLTFTDQQARELVGKNAIIRNIVSNNIRNKIAVETSKLKEESEKALQEKAEEAKKEREQALEERAEEAKKELEQTLQARAEEGKKEREQAVTKAVNMETMKQKAKLGMAEGQARTVKAKLDVVEKAANETPEKPVGEVWEIAKITKAPPPTPAQAPKPAQPPMQGAGSPIKSAAANGVQSPIAQSPNPQAPAPAPAAQPQQVQQQQSPAQQQPQSQDKMQARLQKFGAPSVTAPQAGSAFGQPSFTPPNQPTAPGTSPFQPQSVPQPQVQAGPLAQPARRPSAHVGGDAAKNTDAATQQAPQNGATQVRPPGQSGLPAPRGGFGASTGIPRGGVSMLPRGGASIRGRGGPTGIAHPGQQNGQNMTIQGAAATQGQRGGGMSALPRGGGGIGRGGRGGSGRGGGGGTAGQTGPASPGSMNPVARQFVPGGAPGSAQVGSKRPHEGGDDGSGKRIRGGGGGN